MTALTPDLRVVNHYMALNQYTKGFLVACITVPAVKEWGVSQRVQMYRSLTLTQYWR
jgi:hypothetical protein